MCQTHRRLTGAMLATPIGLKATQHLIAQNAAGMHSNVLARFAEETAALFGSAQFSTVETPGSLIGSAAVPNWFGIDLTCRRQQGDTRQVSLPIKIGPPLLLVNEGPGMASKRHKPEEIVTKLQQFDVLFGQGMARVDAIREVRITEQTCYRWRRQYRGMGTDLRRKLERLQKENVRLSKRTKSASQSSACEILLIQSRTCSERPLPALNCSTAALQRTPALPPIRTSNCRRSISRQHQSFPIFPVKVDLDI